VVVGAVTEVGELVYEYEPRDQSHTCWNAGDAPCCVLELVSPAGFEHLFDEPGERMAAAQVVSVAAVLDVSALAAR
jgi:hypothetical protein